MHHADPLAHWTLVELWRKPPPAPGDAYANMCSIMVVCVLLSRFSLVAALGDRRELLAGPIALGPEAGRQQVVGEVSAAAEAHGVVAGMRVGEALARCPEIRLVPPDPDGVRALWREVLERLERIGASVESDRAGEAYFDADGLHGIHGGDLDGVLRATLRVLERPGARVGAAPARFAARAAALAVRPRRRTNPVVVTAREVRAFLAPLPVALLRARPELEELPETLERLGVRTLGELSALPAASMAERFGHAGILALDLAQGRDTRLEPRKPPEPVVERLALPEAASGMQLERALELLIARVLARPERRGRTLRSLSIAARFVAGGTWRTRVTLRSASADSARLRITLAPRLAELPAPAESLALEVDAFGPPAHDQGRLVDTQSPASERQAKIAEAVRQARQAAGSDAALRVMEIDPGSRIPERRSVLGPYATGEEGA
ncbi:MAG: protein ImuB [Thermoleophilales bacterium]|nr:protein ImuB [Thermoleophilales bacterium]